ncbi:MAG: adenosine deaminase, partial [Ferruginibacter sp.]
MEWTSFPKVELHLHLDCSLSYDVVRALDPTVTLDEYNLSFKAPADCCSLLDYIRCAERPISLMQTEEQLRMVTLDLFNQLKADQVVYAEIRFAPLQHLQKGLTPEQVVQIVHEATLTGIQQTGVQAGLILCTLRHFTEEQSMQTVNLVKAFRGTTVVGFDIAADEVGYPVDAHISAFHFAHQHCIPCTAHAGEACGAPSVWETMKQLRPARIGHGVRSAEDPLLLEQMKVNAIHLEVCPTSNIKTGVFA